MLRASAAEQDGSHDRGKHLDVVDLDEEQRDDEEKDANARRDQTDDQDMLFGGDRFFLNGMITSCTMVDEALNTRESSVDSII